MELTAERLADLLVAFVPVLGRIHRLSPLHDKPRLISCLPFVLVSMHGPGLVIRLVHAGARLKGMRLLG